MKPWKEIQRASKRDFVVVIGYESYFVSKIKEWWQEAHPQALTIKTDSAVNLTPNSNFDGKRYLLPDFHEQDFTLREMVINALKAKDSGLLVFCKSKLDPIHLKWFQSRGSVKFGFIYLRSQGLFDRRKVRWAQEICSQVELIVDARAIEHLIDYCQWDLLMLEGEIWKLKTLVKDDTKIVGHNFIVRNYPIPDRTSDLERLANCKDGWFRDFFVALEGLPVSQQLYRIRKILEQIRVFLMVSRDKEITYEDMEKIRKITNAPMSMRQVKRIIDRCPLSSEQCLRFLSEANQHLLQLSNI